MPIKVFKQADKVRIIYKYRRPTLWFSFIGFIILAIGLYSVLKSGFWGVGNFLFGLTVAGIGVFVLIKRQEIIVDKKLQEVSWQTIKIKFEDIKEFYIRTYSDNPQVLFKKPRYQIRCAKKDGISIELLPKDSNLKDKKQILEELKLLGFQIVKNYNS